MLWPVSGLNRFVFASPHAVKTFSSQSTSPQCQAIRKERFLVTNARNNLAKCASPVTFLPSTQVSPIWNFFSPVAFPPTDLTKRDCDLIKTRDRTLMDLLAKWSVSLNFTTPPTQPLASIQAQQK